MQPADEIKRLEREIAYRDRALELACAHANFGGEHPDDCPLRLNMPCPRGYGDPCFDPSPDACFIEAWIAQARAELEQEQGGEDR